MSVSVPRQPFAVLDSPRLAHLSSSKNRQNGAIPSPLFSKSLKTTNNTTTPPSLNSPSKRRLSLTSTTLPIDFEDSENQSPTPSTHLSSPKRAKFTLHPTPPQPLSAVPNRLLSATPTRANSSSPRAPLTAPAGRSPPRKLGFAKASRARRVSAPFTRIDPPAFSSSAARRSTGLPFSLDAALAGTLSSYPGVATAKTEKAETEKASLFFDIYVDSPEEEAACLMEHSTLTLDLSDDDDAVLALKRAEGRGKENVAPADYEGSAATAAVGVAPASVAVVRRKVVVAEDMDDGERSPLSPLEAEDFFAEGLDEKSVVLVAAGDGVVGAVAGKTKVVVESSASSIETEIFVFEDEAEVVEKGVVGEKRKRGADEVVV